jgi:MFS family permease
VSGRPAPGVSVRDGTRAGRSAAAIILTCALVVLLEGYDQSVYGAVLPALVGDPAWGLSNAEAGYIGSTAFGGMLLGALSSGWLVARYSRRSVVTGCVLVMGVFGTWCAFATSGVELGVLRFLTGAGLGGVLPVTSTITLAVAPARVRNMVYAAMFATIPVGGLLGAVLAIPLIPALGPTFMFALPVPLVLAAATLSWLLLPRTSATERASPDTANGTSGDTADDAFGEPGRARFGGPVLAPTILFIGATLLGLMLWYGLNTWLPGIMRAAGYDLGSSLVFQVVLNAGAAVGSVLVALLADRFGGARATVAIYAGAALVLVASMFAPPRALLYVLILLAGTGAQGGLVVLNTVVDRGYPARLRAQALGLTLGIGRVGAIIAPSVLGQIVGRSSTGSFTFFAGCAIAAGGFAGAAAYALRRAGGARQVTRELEEGHP